MNVAPISNEIGIKTISTVLVGMLIEGSHQYPMK